MGCPDLIADFTSKEESLVIRNPDIS